MTGAELVAKWSRRRSEWAELGVSVSGEKVAAEIVDDLRSVDEDDVLSLAEASALGGYSVDHLARRIRERRLTNAGEKGSPALLRSTVPIKPGHSVHRGLTEGQRRAQIDPVRQIAAVAHTRSE